MCIQFVFNFQGIYLNVLFYDATDYLYIFFSDGKYYSLSLNQNINSRSNMYCFSVLR